MIKAVIFDFDQVIINSYIDHLVAFAVTAKKFGVRLDPKKLYYMFGRSAKDILCELLPSLSENDIKKFINDKEKMYRGIVKTKGFMLMPGVEQTLRMLSNKNIECAISSSSSRKNLLLALNSTGIKKYFSGIVGAEDVKHHKPDPEPLLKAAKLLKINPRECIYIGDSIFEMIAAKKAKMLAVGIHTGIYSERELRKNGARRVIKNIIELKKFFE